MTKSGKNLSTSKKGFTLIETLVALFIFSLAAVMISSAYAGFLKNYVKAKKLQRNIENAQYAMNYLAKTLRTSEVNNVAVFPIRAFDYSQGQCFIFRYANSRIYVANVPSNTGSSPREYSECAWGSPGSDTELTADSIDSAKVRTNRVASGYGSVHILFSVANPLGSPVYLQTTVSLREVDAVML